MGTDLDKSRFHLLPFHAKIVKVFSPDPFVIPLCLEKYIEEFMETASKSNLTLDISSTYLSASLHMGSQCQHLQQNS